MLLYNTKNIRNTKIVETEGKKGYTLTVKTFLTHPFSVHTFTGAFMVNTVEDIVSSFEK